MPNFALDDLYEEYNAKTLRTLLNRMLKKNPEYAGCTIVTYVVNDSGETRMMVCPTRDEVRQIFLSPHCRDARTVRAADKPEESEEADAA